MIAKFTATICCCLFGLSISAQGVNYRSFSFYENIAHKYDIIPPNLNFAYPIKYFTNEVSSLSVIFLKDEVDGGFIKINDYTFVVEPKASNATQILEDEIHNQLVFEDTFDGTIALVVDAESNYIDLYNFIDELTYDLRPITVYLISSNGQFFPLFNQAFGCFDMVCINARDVYQIKMNNRGELLVEQELSTMNDLELDYYEYLTINLDGEIDTDGLLYRILYPERINQQLATLRAVNESTPDDFYIVQELEKWNKMKNWDDRYHGICKSNNLSMVQIELQDENSVSQYFNILNELLKALYRVRNEHSMTQFKLTYYELYQLGQMDKVDYINFQFPNRIMNFRIVPKVEPLTVLPIND